MPSSATANIAEYANRHTAEFINGSPHLKHKSLRDLHRRLIQEVYDAAAQRSPSVLDIGAGEGHVTIDFLALGCKVTAVDISEPQLEKLRHTCVEHSPQLMTRVCDVERNLHEVCGPFDIITAASFLHHIPDYLGLIKRLIPLIKPGGQFLSFQDPLRYDTQPALQRQFSKLSYFAWRVFQPDALRGISRRLRRARGVYLPDCDADNAEYHVVRNGVDHAAIAKLFGTHGFDCRIVRYFSAHSAPFQFAGSNLRYVNHFGILAKHHCTAAK